VQSSSHIVTTKKPTPNFIDELYTVFEKKVSQLFSAALEVAYRFPGRFWTVFDKY